MSPPIVWDYNTMRSWYIKHAKYVEETKNIPIYAIIYESKRPSNSKLGKLEPFVKPNMKWVGLSPIQDRTLFPEKLYTLMDDAESKRRWMFLVYPHEKRCIDGSTEIFGDHLSFCIDHYDKKNPCHFHSTYYTCNVNAGDTIYGDGGVPDYMPRGPASLKKDQNGGILLGDKQVFTKHVAARDFLYEFIGYPWTSTASSGGSGKNKTSSIKDVVRPISTDAFHGEFCGKWLAKELKGMRAFGIVRNDRVHWSVSVLFKGRRKLGRIYRGIHFITRVHPDPIEYERALWKAFCQDVGFM